MSRSHLIDWQNVMKDRLLDDIVKTGFPTELVVSKTFNDFGWITNQNTFYIDEDENKGREIDLVSTKEWPEGGRASAESILLFLSVSVKKSESKPWVFFTSDLTTRDVPTNEMMCLSQPSVREKMPPYEHLFCHPITKFERVGRTHYEGFSQGKQKGIITESILSCVKSSRAEYERFKGWHDGGKGGTTQTFFFSSLSVVEGQIYECYYSKNGHLRLEQREHIPYICNYHSPAYGKGQYLVDVVSMEGLKEFLQAQEEWVNILHQQCYGTSPCPTLPNA